MTMTLRKVALAGALVLAGCNGAKPANEAAATDPSADEAAIKAVETQWMADYNAHNADAVGGHYDPDAAIANPGVALAADAASRRAGIASFVGSPDLKVDFASDKVQIAKSGELAYSRGKYSMSFTDAKTHKPMTDAGSFLTVWRKQADGSWKALEDFVVPGAAAAAPPAAG